MIAFVTACTGGIDAALPLPPHPPGIRSIYYRDEPLPSAAAATWSLSQTIRRSGADDPRLVAKHFKCQIHRLPETAGAEFLVWADACFEFRDLDFVVDWAQASGGERAVLVPHPDRRTVADEYDYVMGELRRGNPYLCERYRLTSFEWERALFAERYDLSALPLWSGGIWLLPNSPAAARFLDRWWEIVRTKSIFDQCAITPLLVEAGLEVMAADLNLYRNAHWRRVPHR